MDDLLQALSAFKQGVTDLAVYRGVSQAADQVQQLKSQAMDETQQRAAQTGLANQLALHLSSIGANPQQVAEAVGALKPSAQAFKKPEEALMSPDATDSTRQRAQDIIDQQHQHEITKLGIAHQADMAKLKLAMGKQEDTKTTAVNKEFDSFGKKLSPYMQVRSSYGQDASTIQQGERLLAAVGGIKSPEEYNAITAQQLPEIATATAKLVGGNQAATDHQLKQFMPQNSQRMFKTAQEWLDSKPTPQELGEYVSNYVKFARREIVGAHGRAEDQILDQSRKNLRLADRDEEQFKISTASALGTTPDKILVQRNSAGKATGVTTADAQSTEQKVQQIADGVKKLRLQAKSADPNIAGPAKKILDKRGIPSDASEKELRYLIKFNLRQSGGN